MDFRLLGPFEVIGDDGTTLAVGTGRQRALLGLLALRANELLTSDRLVEELWGEHAPATAPKMLHNQVSSLRQVLGRNGPLETLGSAYRLNLAPEERDVDRFEALVARGALREALDLWRGPPLADLAFEPFAQTEIARLEERRWAAFEAWADAELARGLHAALIAELEAAVAVQPLRERLHGLLMLALYRAGRQAEALEAYQRARETLVEEAGLEPGPELRALQATILAQVPAPAVCPYMGLSAFDAAHAAYFFGRERLTAELVARLVDARLLAVVGPSGSGKSSAVRAGLLPALTNGVLPGSDRWSIRIVRPHDGLPPADLLFVDQFEEAFAVDGYLDALVAYPGQVVIALRADFYGRCAAHEELARLVAGNQVLVGPLRREELRRAIEEPARRVGLSVEPALTDALIADVLDEPGGLPLLSAALLEQWREREGHALRHAAYERTGGVRGAVGRLAERTYAGMSEAERADARRILLRLAGDGDVRVRMPLGELPDVSVLAESRLVTVDAGSVEVAHEALLREWPRLRGWLDEDAEGRRVHRRLTQAAREFNGDPSELYRGARLAAALDWATAHGDELSAAERSFLDASRVAAERVNRRLRMLVATFAVLLAATLAAGAVALDQRGDARRGALAADAERLGAEAINEDHLDRALALARTGVALDDTPATRGHLLSVLERNPAAVGEVATGWNFISEAISPDGRLLALGDERGSLTVYDARTRLPVAPAYWLRGGLIQNLHFSPDSRRLAVSSVNPHDAARPLADVIDPLTSRRLLRIELPPQRVADTFVVGDVTFLPDGYAVLATTFQGPPSLLYRLDARGSITGRIALGTAASFPTMSAAGGHVFVTSASADRTWEVDPERLRVLQTFAAGDAFGVVSPDGRRYALGGAGGRVRLIDVASGAVRTLGAEHRADITALVFTPDSRTLVTGDADGRLIVRPGTAAASLPGHTSKVQRLAVSPDGRTLVSLGDRRAMLWDLEGDRRLDRPFSAGPDFPVDDTPRGLDVSPDGRTLAVTEIDGSVELIDTTTLRRRATVPALDRTALSVAFSPDGRTLAVTGDGGRVTLWDARTLAPRGELYGLGAVSQALAFSPDGHRLAAAEQVNLGPKRPLRVWDVRTRRLTAFRARGLASLIAFSPDGRWLASAADEAGAEVFDAATGRRATRIRGDARSVAFSPDSRLLFMGQYDGHARLYDTETWRPLGREFDGHGARITFASFSADRRVLATSGADGRVVLWDVATQKPISSPLALTPEAFASVVLSGSHLFAVSTEGPARRLDISPASWKRQACLIAGHDLSSQEWADALPGRPQTPVCGPITDG